MSIKTAIIAIYIQDFTGGGAEMVTVRLANELAAMGRPVHILVNQDKGILRSQVDPNVVIIDLKAQRTLAALPKLIAYLKKVAPAAMISGLLHNNIIAIAAHLFARRLDRLFICQHNTFSMEAKRSLKYFASSVLFAVAIRFCDHIIAVSRGAADNLIGWTAISPQRVTVIYNPIVTSAFEEKADHNPEHPWLSVPAAKTFVAVGRLTPQKDYPTLMRAFALVRQSIDAKLIVLGEGVLLEELKAETIRLNIADSVEFIGFQSNPLAYIKRACALVLTSKFEGFGNVLAEALACGTQVISTACNGPTEILDNGRFGALVPIGDHQAIAQAMIAAAEEQPDRNYLRTAAIRFRTDIVARQYLDLIENHA
jgi:glycosyltransferase involved in cell wall biosynthesis